MRLLIALALLGCEDAMAPVVEPRPGRLPPQISLSIEPPAALPSGTFTLRWSIDPHDDFQMSIRAQGPGTAPPPDDREPGMLSASGDLFWLASDDGWSASEAARRNATALGSVEVSLPNQSDGEWRFDLLVYGPELLAIDSAAVLATERRAIRLRHSEITMAAGRTPAPVVLAVVLDGELEIAHQGPSMNRRIELSLDRPGTHRAIAELLELETGMQIGAASASWTVEERPLASDGLPKPRVLAIADAEELYDAAIGGLGDLELTRIEDVVADLDPFDAVLAFRLDGDTLSLVLSDEELIEHWSVPFDRAAELDLPAILPAIRRRQERPIDPRLTLSLAEQEIALGAQASATITMTEADGSPLADQPINVSSSAGRTDANGMLALRLPPVDQPGLHTVEATWTAGKRTVRSNRVAYRALAPTELFFKPSEPLLKPGSGADVVLVAREGGAAKAGEHVAITARLGTVPAAVTTDSSGNAAIRFDATSPGLGRIDGSASVGSASIPILIEAPLELSLRADVFAIEATVGRGRILSPGVAVELSSSAGAIDPPRAGTDASGVARATFVPPAGNGTASITARLTLRGETITRSIDVAY